MDFELSAEQEELQQGIRKRLAGRFPLGVVRAMEAGLDRDRWRELGEAGVFALRLPEARGGVGLGAAEAVLVFEELGRSLVPGPLVASHLAAGLVPGAATGERVVGALDRDVTGMPLLVEHLAALDALVVVDPDGIWLIDPAELDGVAVSAPLDPLTPVHLVASLAGGERVAGPEAVPAWQLTGAVLTAALQLGIAEAVTDAAVAYAKERVQFDRPIGAFQAVKHLLADMLVRVEMARAAVYAAGVTLDDPEVGDPARAAGAAKILAGEAALSNAKTNIQVHGGMGFTWEVEAHLFLKRAWVLDTVFGTSDHHAEALAGGL